MKQYKNESGFTLIEILIVVLIIGIIAALAIPNLLSAQQVSWANTCKANRTTIIAAAELYRIQDNGTEPEDLDALKEGVNGFDPVMRSIPECPAGGTDTYELKLNNGIFTVNCSNIDDKHPSMEEEAAAEEEEE